jgi:hypothetical protein
MVTIDSIAEGYVTSQASNRDRHILGESDSTIEANAIISVVYIASRNITSGIQLDYTSIGIS